MPLFLFHTGMIHPIQLRSWQVSSLTSWIEVIRRYAASIVVAILLVVQTFSAELFEWTCGLFLAAGFIFPGMMHGALDFHLIKRHSTHNVAYGLLVIYLMLIAAMLTAWLFFPVQVFIVFLLVSAFHFGDTDFNASKSRNRLTSALYGALLLTFVFFTHEAEASNYLELFGFKRVVLNDTLKWVLIAVNGVSLCCIMYFNLNRPFGINIASVLIMGCFLPLLVTFGIYYLMVHSLTAWRDLRDELKMNHVEMVRLALPYTFGGCAVLIAVYFFFDLYKASLHQPLVLMIAGVAAITLPHAITMAIHYYRTKISNGKQLS